ncbi:ImuA family protein [Parasphingorhabdus sp.]|uniref:ImuA family protein n=1 Tax=Parasphingorhabdus sp. TaxID=2709688 RepID=UPI003BB0D2A9
MNISDSIHRKNKGKAASLSLSSASCLDENIKKGGAILLGAQRFDHALRQGLPKAALHEVQAALKDDTPCASAFCLLLAERCRLSGQKGSNPILWVDEKQTQRCRNLLYPPGLVELGIDPNRIIYAQATTVIAALKTAADAVRSNAVVSVILALSGKNPRGLDLTATRRLSLFARESGVTVFLLRDQLSSLSTAAYSRWQISSAPSRPLEANAPGHPVFDVKLLRHRRGIEGLSSRLEWNRDSRIFEEYAPDIGAVPAVSVFGTDYQEQRRRA